MNGLLKALLPLVGEGLKEGAKALVSWARSRREKRESDMEHFRRIQRDHVERRDLSNDTREKT